MNTCISCGAVIPEGRLVCPNCELGTKPDAVLADGTPLYFKTTREPADLPLQLFIYNLLNRKK